MVKAYPWCWMDWQPHDSVCTECPWKNACKKIAEKPLPIEYFERLARMFHAQRLVSVPRAFDEVKKL